METCANTSTRAGAQECASIETVGQKWTRSSRFCGFIFKRSNKIRRVASPKLDIYRGRKAAAVDIQNSRQQALVSEKSKVKNSAGFFKSEKAKKAKSNVKS